MKQLMENWQKYLKEEQETIDTPKGEVPIDKELKDELENLSPEEINAILQALQQANESLNKWETLYEGINLDTGLMSKLGKWSKSVGLAAAIIGISAIAGGSAQAASPVQPPEIALGGHAQGFKLGIEVYDSVEHLKKDIAEKYKTSEDNIGIKSFGETNPETEHGGAMIRGRYKTVKLKSGEYVAAYNLAVAGAGDAIR